LPNLIILVYPPGLLSIFFATSSNNVFTATLSLSLLKHILLLWVSSVLDFVIKGSINTFKALAFVKDKHVLQTIGQCAIGTTPNVTGGDTTSNIFDANIASATDATAATAMIGAIFSAAKQLDGNYVPAEGRKCFLRLEEYYKLANATNVINADFSGKGSIAEGKVARVAGIDLIPVPHFVETNVTSGVDAGSATAGGSTPQAVDLRTFVALVSHPSAVGTVKLMDLAVESEYDIRRQGTLMVAKYAMGHDVLRPEAAVGIKQA